MSVGTVSVYLYIYTLNTAPTLSLKASSVVPSSVLTTDQGNIPAYSAVDPNRLCPDPETASHVHWDPDPDLAPEPNRIQRLSDPDPAHIFKLTYKQGYYLCKNVIFRAYVLFKTHFKISIHVNKQEITFENMKI